MISLQRSGISNPYKNLPYGCNQNAIRNFRVQKEIRNEQHGNLEKKKKSQSFMGLEQSKQEILQTFSQLLKNIVKSSVDLSLTPSIFNIKGKASIEIEPFVTRISEFMNCSQSCFVVAIILLDRIQTMNQGFILCNSNIHKLIITSMLIAVKYCDDDTYRNTYYAKIGGLSVEDLNKLQAQFLNMINFEVYVGPQVYQNYSAKLRTYLKRKNRARTQN